jgi:hypothetical protein
VLCLVQRFKLCCLDTKSSEFINLGRFEILSEILDCIRRVFRVLCFRILVILAFVTLEVRNVHIHYNCVGFNAFILLYSFDVFGMRRNINERGHMF